MAKKRRNSDDYGVRIGETTEREFSPSAEPQMDANQSELGGQTVAKANRLVTPTGLLVKRRLDRR